MAKITPLRKRLAPSVPFVIEFEDEKGKSTQNVQLAFNFNSIAYVEEATGVNLLHDYLYIYKHADATNVSIFFVAALLPYQPEYGEKDGLEIVRSFIDFSNCDAIMRAVLKAFKLSLSPELQQMIEDADKAIEEQAKKLAEQGSEASTEKSGSAPLVQEK
jgi:hypothetical protein